MDNNGAGADELRAKLKEANARLLGIEERRARQQAEDLQAQLERLLATAAAAQPPDLPDDRFADAPSTRTTGRLDSAPSTTATFSAQRPKPHTLPTGPARSPPRTTFPHPPASSTILFPSTPTRARPSASASAPPPAAAAVPLPSTTTNDPSNAGNTSLIDSPGAARHLRQARPDTASPSLPDLGLPGFDDLFPHDTSRHDSPPLARLPDRRYKGLRRDTSVRRDRESDREEMRDGVEDDEDHGTLDGTEPGGSTIVVKRGKQPTKKRDVNPRRHNVRNGSECRSMDNANDQPGETFGSRGRDRSNSEGHRSDTHRSTDEEQDPDEESEKEETRRPDPKRRRKAEPAIGMKRKDREESDTGTEQRKRQDQKQMNAKLALAEKILSNPNAYELSGKHRCSTCRETKRRDLADVCTVVIGVYGKKCSSCTKHGNKCEFSTSKHDAPAASSVPRRPPTRKPATRSGTRERSESQAPRRARSRVRIEDIVEAVADVVAKVEKIQRWLIRYQDEHEDDDDNDEDDDDGYHDDDSDNGNE